MGGSPPVSRPQQQASSAQVKEVGAKISAEHAELDARVREVADQLGVLLPSSPSAQQIAWMDEISSTTGSDYDRTFVQRLREAHGIVLPVLAQVRAGTQNELVRAFAVEADAFVSRHMEYLESTGLVDHCGPAAPRLAGPVLHRARSGRPHRAGAGLPRHPARRGRPGRRHAQARDPRAPQRARGAAASTPPGPSAAAMISLPAPRVTDTGPRHAIRR